MHISDIEHKPLKISAAWRLHQKALKQCTNCGASLIAYIPKCLKCQTLVQSVIQELDHKTLDFKKAEGIKRIMHLSDLHVRQPVSRPVPPMAIFKMWLSALVTLEIDVLIVTGDLIERPGDRYGLHHIRALLDDFGPPWVVVPGNHDIKKPGDYDIFNEFFGLFPRIETHAGIDFILLDSMAGLSHKERALAERVYGDYVCYTEGRVGEKQLSDMEAILAKNPERERAIVLHHHMMRQHADLMPGIPKSAGVSEDLFGTMKTLMDADILFEWATEHDISAIYHGHKHLFQPPGLRAGNLLVLNAGSSTLKQGNQKGRFVDYDIENQSKTIVNLELVL